jgi:hypothetical protein
VITDYVLRMEYVDIAALFVTTFLGAFLAFGLENLRERRRITGWVRQHIGHVRTGMVDEVQVVGQIDQLLGAQIDAIDAWLAATDPGDLSEAQWDLIASSISASAPDYGAVLRSEAVTAVPADLALALSQIESSAVGIGKATDLVHASLDTVLPLWFQRTAPLSEPDRRRVLRLRESVVNVIELARATQTPLENLVNAIDRWLN